MFKPPTQLCHRNPFSDRAELQPLTGGTAPSSDAASPGWSDTTFTLPALGSQFTARNNQLQQ